MPSLSEIANWVFARYFPRSNFLSASRGSESADHPVKLNRDGKLDSSLYDIVQLEDANFTLVDDLNAAKKGMFQLSGVTAGNTRTLTWPDASGTLALLSLAQSWSALQTFSAGITARLSSAGLIINAGTLSITEGAVVFGTGFVRAGTDADVLLNVVRSGTGVVAYGAAVSGDTFRRIVIGPEGLFQWSAGNLTYDTNLYRSAANLLKTDDSFEVAGDIINALIRQANETGQLILLGGSSVTEGPYIHMYGRSNAAAEKGNIHYIATSEGGAAGQHRWYNYDGSAYNERMRLLANGNLGIGTSDIESWHADYLGVEMGGRSSIMARRLTDAGLWLNDNAYFDGAWKRKVVDSATNIAITDGVITFNTIGSGDTTTGFTWTEIMRLLADGSVGIGTITPAMLLEVEGASAGIAVDADSGNPQVALYEAGTAQWSLYYDITNNRFAIHEVGVGDKLRIADGGAITIINTLNVNGATDLDSTLNVDGAATFNAATTVKPGTASDTAKVGGVLYVTTTTAGNNAVAGADTLATFSIPANTLAVDGQSIWWEAWGSFASNANSKSLNVFFGASGTRLVYNFTTSQNGDGWYARGRVIRTGAATQVASGMGIIGTSARAPGNVTPNQTLSGAVTFSITGDGTAANDITLNALTIGWDGENT